MKIFKTMLASIALAAISTLALAAPAQAADLDFNYTLSTGSSSGTSVTSGCGAYLGNFYYETQAIHVTQAGDYALTSHVGADGDSFGVLYSQQYNPANPTAGCLTATNVGTGATVPLDTNTTYWVYLSTHASNVVGTFRVTASGPGNIIQGEAPAATSTSLSVTPASITVGDSVTLVATITGLNPTGAVDFFNGSDLVGSATVHNGEATLTYVPSTLGSEVLTALYSGDDRNDWSVSLATTLIVNAVPTPHPNPDPKPIAAANPAPQLAATGSNQMGATLLASLSLLGAGGALMLRKRSQARKTR